MLDKREKWRRAWSGAVVAAVMIAAVVLGLYLGGLFPEPSPENWQNVKIRMTKSEVRKLVGAPNGLSYGPLPPEREFVDGYYIDDRKIFYVRYIDGVVVSLNVPPP
jgi:hypothetical protein